MRVEGTATGELDVKRCYLPGVVLRSQCPKCSADYAEDMAHHYLSYPKVGKPEAYGCYCRNEACGHEWEVMLRLDVTLSVVSPEVQP
jgi:hypothetical protein